jgi:large subunit ribosomal protein L21
MQPASHLSDAGAALQEPVQPGRGKGKGHMSAYAVVRTGGKQYKMGAGDIIEVDRLDGEVGEVLTLTDVLMVVNGDSVTVGTPVVDGVTVMAKITGQYRGAKIMVFKYRPKKRIRVRKGHRQYITRLQVESVG